MRRVSLRIGIFAVAVASMLAMAAPAGARTTARPLGHRPRHAIEAVPDASIGGKGAKAKYTPARIRAQRFTDLQCVMGAVSFTISNASPRTTYEVTGANGKSFFSIAPGEVKDICSAGTKSRTQLGIKGSKHLLTVDLVS